MKTTNYVACTRCEGIFRNPGDLTTKTTCPYCSFGFVVNFERSGYTGTQRTAGNTADSTAATGVTVT